MAARAYFGVAELAHLPAFHLSAKLRGHGLHAIADAEHRHAKLEHGLRRARGAALVYRRWAAGEDDRPRRELAHECVASRREDGSRSTHAFRARGARSAACTARRSRESELCRARTPQRA